LTKRGAQQRGAQQLAATDTPAFDVTLLEGLGRAFYWQNLLDSGMEKSGSAIARKEGLHHSCINELMRLTLLAPDLIDLLMAGRQPRRLSLMWFQRNRLPVDWQAQRHIIVDANKDDPYLKVRAQSPIAGGSNTEIQVL
jgi:hypothetical protein